MPPHSDLEDTYILHVRLAHTKDPTISRVLCVPTDLEFNLFHLVLQAAFGWAETHLYKFTVSKPLPRGQVISDWSQSWFFLGLPAVAD